jgi:hypothetical protein
MLITELRFRAMLLNLLQNKHSHVVLKMASQSDWAIPIIIRTPLLRNLGISREGGALTLEFPGERVH